MNKKALSFYLLLFVFSIGLTNNIWACSSNTLNIDNNKPVVNETVTITYNGDMPSYEVLWQWDFGEDAVPEGADNIGPHQVYYTTLGEKIVTLFLINSANNSADLSFETLNVIAPVVSLPHTFRRSSGSIDVNNDGEIDFSIEYSSSGSNFNYRIVGVNEENEVLVETLDLLDDDPQPNYASILPYLTLIEHDGFGDAPPLQGTPLANPAGSSWANEAILLGAPSLDNNSLQANTFYGAEDGYVGVYYNVSGSYYTGWLHYKYISYGAFTLLSVGSAIAPDAPVAAGFGDPFDPVVPVSIIGTLVAFLAIGGGSYLKRKRKK